ncbi:UNVERIFIED_CONTAM: Enzymatic polyprotein [Sesamum radiatum]|uniref:Enzymatic polyprotein n=1 Tax=Sesamum radiatum TaxID=300843 RepID=A0AAW2PND0_SESRA
MLQPLHPYGTILNLDIIDFRNTEKLIDEWVAALKIAATTLELDRENFIRLVELSLEGSVKIGWDNTPEDTKANILAGDSKSAIAERLGRLIKIHFIGDGTSGSRTEKAREYTQALFGLELRNICTVDEYIYWFRKYFFQSGVATKIAAPMFFAKICSPWREMLIQAYKVPEGQLDSVARRMSFLKDKLKDWCYQASIQKNMKRLRGTIKRTPLCCDNNDFPTIIENQVSQGRGKNRTTTPTLGVLDEPLSGENHGSPNPRPEPTNLDRGQDRQGLHPKDLDEQMQDPQDELLQRGLSDGLIPVPMKVSKTAITGPAEQKLIPKEEILEELSKLREEVAVTMKWIHIGAIEVQPVIGRYEGMLEIAGHEILVAGVAGKENGSMTLGLNFLEDHKPWGRKGNGMEFSLDGTIIRIEMTSPFSIYISVGRDFSQKILILNKGIREAKIMIGGAFGSPWFRDKRKFGKVLLSFRQQGLIESDSFYEESEKELLNLKEALQEIKSLDISEESKLSLENVKKLIQRNFSENPLAWWDRNKIEATLKVKEERKYEYVRYKPIQMNMEDKKDMQMIIKEHINLRLIEPGVSAYSSLGFLIRNYGEIKRGKPRLVINYQGINKILEFDGYYIPSREHLIDCIKGAKVFSKFDCKSDFYQIKMENESKKFTAFSTPHGQYIWNVLPMGLANAPQIFQRKMDNLFKDYFEFIFVYIDILIASKNMKDHIKHLEIVSDACHKERLVLSEKKAIIAVNKIEFLGILIDETGFRPLLKETESSKWKWEEIHTQRVRELKQVCSNLPKLAIPQDEDELVVYTDANDYRRAAVLMKKTTTGEEPCRYTGGLFSEQQAQV